MEEDMIIKNEEQKPTSPNFDMYKKIMKLIEDLEKGKKSAHMMRGLIIEEEIKNPKASNKSALNHHSVVCVNTFVTSLAILDQVFARNRNQVHVDDEFPDKGSFRMSTSKGRIRECYKKRKIGRSSLIGRSSREEEVTQLTGDGSAWRKYGQKMILNCHHPRQYYRCTQKYDQNCPATKQVQQVSDKPNKYKIIYNGNHTCNKNFSKTPPSFTIENVPRDHPSSSILSFEQSNQVNSMLFPTTSPFPTGGLAILQSQYSSPSVSPNNLSISQDMTATYPLPTMNLSQNTPSVSPNNLSISQDMTATYPLPTMNLSQNTPSVSPNNLSISQDMTATYPLPTMNLSQNTPSVSPNNLSISQDMTAAYPLPTMSLSQNTPSLSPNNLSISQDMTATRPMTTRVSSTTYPLPTMRTVSQNTASVSSNNVSISRDMTAMTSGVTTSSYPAGSGMKNEFSGAEIYSSTASSVMNVEEDEFSFMMDDYSDIVRDFSDLLPDRWTS